MALMAPTEILAKQHYEFQKKFLRNINIKNNLLTGKTEYQKRKRYFK